MEGIALLRLAASELAAGRDVIEVVVLASEGSVARPAGARMLALEDGRFEGTVGGGAPEYKCQRAAREMLAAGARARARRVVVNHASTGMVCGGSQVVGIRRLGDGDGAVLEHALSWLDAGGEGMLETDWTGDAPRAAFSPVAAQGSKGVARAVEAAAAPGDGAPSTVVDLPGVAARMPQEPLLEVPRYAGDRFFEPLHQADRVIIFGGGHVGRALVPVLAAIDFDVVLFDNRPEVARPESFPQASRVILGDYGRIDEAIEVRERDYACVMTHGHAFDTEVVCQLLARRPRYLGCMGSRRKKAVVHAALAKQGFSAREIAHVELPIGLSIGGSTPAEIAVSVAARLIQVRSLAAEAATGEDQAKAGASSSGASSVERGQVKRVA